MKPAPAGGPMHPCPVCGSAHQTCDSDIPWTEPDNITVRPDQGFGPLYRTIVDGRECLMTWDDMQREGVDSV